MSVAVINWCGGRDIHIASACVNNGICESWLIGNDIVLMVRFSVMNDYFAFVEDFAAAIIHDDLRAALRHGNDGRTVLHLMVREHPVKEPASIGRSDGHRKHHGDDESQPGYAKDASHREILVDQRNEWDVTRTLPEILGRGDYPTYPNFCIQPCEPAVRIDRTIRTWCAGRPGCSESALGSSRLKKSLGISVPRLC